MANRMTTTIEDPHTRTQPEARVEPHESRESTPGPARPPRSRGLIWLVLLLIIVGVAGYAVWRAGQPVASQAAQEGGRGGDPWHSSTRNLRDPGNGVRPVS